MASKTIFLPSLRDEESGYRFLFRLASHIIDDPHSFYYLNFSKCSVFEQNAVAMLGGLCNYVNRKNSLSNKRTNFGGILSSIVIPTNRIGIKVDTMSQPIKSSLTANKFFDYFEKKHGNKLIKGNYIGYREHEKILNDDEIAQHLSEQWLTNEKLKISNELKSAIISKIFEIFMNAYGHGVQDNSLGLSVISCGQHYLKDKKLSLTVLDFGAGIIDSVKGHLKIKLSDKEAMEWALEQGNSTRTDSINNIPRGLGFGILKDFVKINKGSIKIYSNTCSAHLDSNGNYIVNEMIESFKGTMVTVTINCDDRYYRFKPEPSNKKSFF
jgi:hypothetical protein